MAPSPRRLANRCWPADRPDSDPAGWTPESEPSPLETQRSHPPAPPRSPAAPEPVPEGSKVIWSDVRKFFKNLWYTRKVKGGIQT